MEESLRVGVPLESALDAVQQWASGFADLEPPSERVQAQRQAASEEAAMIERNNQALGELRRMMPGLGV